MFAFLCVDFWLLLNTIMGKCHYNRIYIANACSAHLQIDVVFAKDGGEGGWLREKQQQPNASLLKSIFCVFEQNGIV